MSLSSFILHSQSLDDRWHFFIACQVCILHTDLVHEQFAVALLSNCVAVTDSSGMNFQTNAMNDLEGVAFVPFGLSLSFAFLIKVLILALVDKYFSSKNHHRNN